MKAPTGDRDTELAQRAADGDRICRQLLPALMTTDGDLDGSVESLRLIDGRAEKLRGIMNVLDPAAEGRGAGVFMSREAVCFMLGAYLGEMARRELEPLGARVRWEAGGEGQISMTRSHLVISRGGEEERWAVFHDAREWLDGRLEVAFYDSMRQLLLLA